MALDAANDPVAARHAIFTQVYLTYARGMDRNHNQLHADAFWDEGEQGGPAGLIHSASFHGPKQALLQKGLGFFERQYRHIRHPIMNHIVKLDLAKGKAVAETFFHDGYIQWANADNSKNSREPFDGAVLKTRELIGRYADELECRNGIWKFMSRTVMFDWSRIDTIPPHRMPSVEPFKSAFAQGTRLPYKDGSFQKDPSFALLPLFPNPSQTQSDMVNKYQIERLVVAWTRQLDRWINGDPSILNGLVDTYFAAGATVRDGTSSPVSIADYLAALRDLTKKHKVTDRTSVCSNHLISLDPANPNRAVGEHYIDLHLLVPDLSTFNPDPANAGVSGRMWFAGRYVDEYLRGPDGIWRFASRNLVVDWIRLVPHAPGLPPKASDPFTRGNFADPAQDPGVKFIPDAGLIARQPADRDEIERMMAVTDALLTYTRGIDRRDADLITAAYHKGAYDNHGPFQGTAEKFVEWAMAGQKANFGSHHGLTNVVMHFESRTKAKVESRVVDRSLFKDKKTGKEKITWFAGRYLDEVEQRDGVWRIASRVVVLDWSAGDPIVDKPTKEWAEMFPIGQLDKSDLTYKTFAKLEAGQSGKL